MFGLKLWGGNKVFKKLEGPALRNINWWALSLRSLPQIQDPVQSSYLQAPVLDTSHQATNKTGMQKCSSVDRPSKLILSSQTCQYTPADTALPIRRKKLSSTHQKTNTSPSSQEAYTSHWTNLTHQGQRPESRGTILQSVETRPVSTNTVKQNEKTEKYVSDGGSS